MTQTLEERIAEFKQIYADIPKAKDALEIITKLQDQNKAWQEMVQSTRQTNQALVTRLCEFGEEKDELLAKNREFEEELEERKAYIVANPCAQCGGRINAMKCDAWAKKAKELEGKVEIANWTLMDLRNNFELDDTAFNRVEKALDKLNKQGEAHDE
jgi:DNA repair exonuclease SbcCD ATPase subunit